MISTNMLMPIPSVGQTVGPQWATDINNCLTIVDNHNHTPGYGTPVPPDGLDINADLPFQNNNLTGARSLRMQPQNAVLSLPDDLTQLYVVGSDLYYNDADGNQIRITQSGAVAGTPGSIANLVSPASASYVAISQKFVWQSNVNTAANMDFAAAIMRNQTPGSFSLTLQPPNAMSSNTVITLPTIPSVSSVVTMDTSGNMGTTPTTNLMPVGATIPFSGSSTPSGFLLCDGSAVSRTTYAALFGVIGTTFGDGDGSTTFNVPDATEQLYFRGVDSVPAYIDAYWGLDQTTGGEPNLAATGNIYDLAEVGTVPAGVGIISAASRGPFSASDYFRWSAGSSSATIFDSQTFFVDAWFKTSDTGNFKFIAGKTDGNIGWHLFIGTDNKVYVQIYVSGVQQNLFSAGTVTDGNWHYVAAIYSTATNGFRLYLDNVLEAQASHPAGITASTADLQIGLRPVSLDWPFVGQLESISFASSFPDYGTLVSLINQRWNSGAGSGFNATVAINYIIKT